MTAGVAAGRGGAGTAQLVLVALVVAAAAFGAAFAIASMTKEDPGGGTVRQATPIEPSAASPKLPAAPPAASLPALKAAPAPPSGTPAPAPAPAPAPGGGGGGGGPIIEG